MARELHLGFPGRVSVYIDPEPTWQEMHQRQELLESARRSGATHIALIDADEILTGNLLSEIRYLVSRTPQGQCLSIPKIDCWEGIQQYRDEHPFTAELSLAFPDQSDYAWTDRRYGYQHHCRPPRPLTRGFCPQVEGGIFHLQFARPWALRAKQAHYKMVELLRWPQFGVEKINRRYSWWNTSPKKLTPVPEAWWAPYRDWMHLLDLSDDGGCWHEQELRKLLDQHGLDRFRGLDLFGVA
jgi:hypothetical protein